MDCVHTLLMFMERRLESVREDVVDREEVECLATRLKFRICSICTLKEVHLLIMK